MSEEQAQPQLALERIYTKDMSLEVASAAVFTKEWKPELDISLSSNAEKLDESHFHVVLTITVNATNDEKPAFIAEVHQAGIFLVEGVADDQMEHLLGAYCPNVLFPYAREVISDIVSRGSFPQLLLQPVNFDQAFVEAQKKATAEKEA